MLALLPATATAVGFIVLRQAPTVVRRQGRPQGGTAPGPLTLTHTGLWKWITRLGSWPTA